MLKLIMLNTQLNTEESFAVIDNFFVNGDVVLTTVNDLAQLCLQLNFDKKRQHDEVESIVDQISEDLASSFRIKGYSKPFADQK